MIEVEIIAEARHGFPCCTYLGLEFVDAVLAVGPDKLVLDARIQTFKSVRPSIVYSRRTKLCTVCLFDNVNEGPQELVEDEIQKKI